LLERFDSFPGFSIDSSVWLKSIPAQQIIEIVFYVFASTLGQYRWYRPHASLTLAEGKIRKIVHIPEGAVRPYNFMLVIDKMIE